MGDARGSHAPKWQPSEGLRSWLEGLTAETLDVVEYEGRPAYREHIVRKNPKTGKHEEVPVRIVSPSHLDRAKARIDALGWLTQLAKRKGNKERLTWDEACAIFGPVYVDEMDTVCLVARCCRDEDDPQHQHQSYDELDRIYGRASIVDLWERLCVLDAWTDPRISDVSEEDFWAIVERVDKVGNSSPLAVISGAERDSFIASMASRLVTFRSGSSASPSGATSTPDR